MNDKKSQQPASQEDIRQAHLALQRKLSAAAEFDQKRKVCGYKFMKALYDPEPDELDVSENLKEEK